MHAGATISGILDRNSARAVYPRPAGPAVRHGLAGLAWGVGLLTLTGIGGAQEVTGEATDTLRLRFDWHPGLEGRVEVERLRVRRTPGGEDTTFAEARYRLRALDHPEGRVIVHEEVTLPTLQLAAAVDVDGERMRRRLSDHVEAVAPGCVVRDDGAFLRLEGGEALAAAIGSHVERVLAGRPRDELERIRRALGSLLTEEFLRNLAAQEWNALVGFWARRGVVTGRMQELRRMEEVPFFADMRIPTVYQYRTAGRVPCHEADPDRSCVELRLRSFPDAESLHGGLERTMEELGAEPGEGPGVRNLVIENSVLLVTEPRTLIPHRLETRRRVSGSVAREEREPAPFGLTERATYRYVYPDRR